MTHPANLDPLLLALVQKLPARDDGFLTGDRERWLLAMDAALQFLYPPAWAADARAKAKKARTEVEPTITAEQVVDAAMTLARVKEEAAAHFPTIEAKGGVTLAGPVPEPVLLVPPGYHRPPVDIGLTSSEMVEAMRRTVEGTIGEAEREATDHVRRATGSDDYVVKFNTTPLPEEASSQTIADVVDDASGGEEAAGSSAGPAPVTSSPPFAPTQAATSSSTGPSTSAPTSPSTTPPAPARSDVPPPQEGRKRHFTADMKGAILRRVVREGMPAVQADTMIHESTLNRWIREMPIAVQTFTEEWEAEQREKALAEGGPTVGELEAEKERPVLPRPEPKAKPAIQWPTAPIERRPVLDPDAVMRRAADGL